MKKIVLVLLLNILIFPLVIISSTGVYAATTDSTKGLGCGGGLGPLADILCGQNNPTSETVGLQLNKLISGVIGFMTIVASLWYIFQIITGGYQWIAAGGDKNQLGEARDKIVNSTIGLIIVVAAWVIVAIIGQLLGINILNPGKVLQTLGT